VSFQLFVWKVCLDCDGVEVSELEAGWHILVGSLKNSREKAQQNSTEGALTRFKFDRWPAKSDD